MMLHKRFIGMIKNEKTLKGCMMDTVDKVRKAVTVLVKILPVISFIIPMIILYFLYPNSFESTWKGRLYYMFFLWLVSLETILSWETLNLKTYRLKSIKTVLILIASLLPLIYVLVSQFLGLNTILIDLALNSGMDPNMANNFFPLFAPTSRPSRKITPRSYSRTMRIAFAKNRTIAATMIAIVMPMFASFLRES